ncbi:MAG: hypothetical protein GXY44_16425 [Phycisphaerales bacterium]|nr:hypothetical protein [Phycisphaerales bacterium]
MPTNHNRVDRRGFLRQAATGIGVAAVGTPSASFAQEQRASAVEKPTPEDVIWRSKAPTMAYRRLGRTKYMVSRLIAGWGGDDRLWRRMVQSGINYIDTARGYGNHEEQLRNFLQRFRERIWITSKSTGIAGYNKIDDEVEKLYRNAMNSFLGDGSGDMLTLHHQAVTKQKESGDKPDLRPIGAVIARLYTSLLDESLARMGIDDVDCYMMHGIEIPWIFDCVELWEAYEKVHKAGKVKHFGFSVHKHHKEVLAAGIEANARGPWKIDLVMPGVNPESFDHLKDELAALKKQDVGIIAMKTSGIKNRPVDGREKKFDSLMGGREYNEWERAKLWMLHLTEDLIDGVIAGITGNEELEKDLQLPSVQLSAAARRELDAIVKLEMAGACHLCGDCATNCPEHIAVTDMIRYHAYIHQYDDKEMARELYAMAGYDPAALCNNCGHCTAVCPSQVPITQLLRQLSLDMRA